LPSPCFAKGNPKNEWLKYTVGGAQVHDLTKILWKFHKIPSSGTGGVADTKVWTDRWTPPSLYTTGFKAGGWGYDINQTHYRILCPCL